MGGKGGAPKLKASPLEQAQADIAKRQDARSQLMEQQWIDPIRNSITPNLLTALGTNPFQTSLNAGDRHTLEAQYNQAKNNIMNTAMPGGMMRSQRAGLERDRAMAIGNAANQAKQLGIGRALQFAGGALPTQASVQSGENSAMQGLGQANTSMANRAQQNYQNAAQQSAGKGQLAGQLGKGALSLFL